MSFDSAVAWRDYVGAQFHFLLAPSFSTGAISKLVQTQKHGKLLVSAENFNIIDFQTMHTCDVVLCWLLNSFCMRSKHPSRALDKEVHLHAEKWSIKIEQNTEIDALCFVCAGVLCTVEMKSWSLAGWCSVAVASSTVPPPLMPSLISCARSLTPSLSRYCVLSVHYFQCNAESFSKFDIVCVDAFSFQHES